eukprot:11992900-Alexandrium_andersonii.AAC.1
MCRAPRSPPDPPRPSEPPEGSDCRRSWQSGGCANAVDDTVLANTVDHWRQHRMWGKRTCLANDVVLQSTCESRVPMSVQSGHA